MAEIDLSPSLNSVSQKKKKNRLVCGKLMSKQILTRFDPDKKSAVLRQKNRLVCGGLKQSKCGLALDNFSCIFALSGRSRPVGITGELCPSVSLHLANQSARYIGYNHKPCKKKQYNLILPCSVTCMCSESQLRNAFHLWLFTSIYKECTRHAYLSAINFQCRWPWQPREN